MNGASAEPCAKTSRPPNASITTISGTSQYFLRCRVYFQSSDINPPFAIDPPVSELTFEIAAPRVLRTPHPRTLGWRRSHQIVPAERSHQQARWCDDHEVQDTHDDGRRDLRDRGRETVPRALHRAELRRRHDAGDDQQSANRAEHHRDRRLPAPANDAGEHQERDTDGE